MGIYGSPLGNSIGLLRLSRSRRLITFSHRRRSPLVKISGECCVDELAREILMEFVASKGDAVPASSIVSTEAAASTDIYVNHNFN